MKNKDEISNSTAAEIPVKLNSLLLIFDIDGTMTDTKSIDDRCYVETLEELYGFDLSKINWENFEHVTDAGLTEEIYMKYKGRSISKSEIKRVQTLFYKKLSNALQDDPETMKPILGITDFLDEIRNKQISIAIATGGWRKTAELKLQAADIFYDGFTLATSNDSYKRRTIMNVAIARAQFEYQKKFDKMIYFGDGIWDVRTCEAMGIPMIGIDFHKSGRLNAAVVEHVFRDFSDRTSIFKAIEQIVLNYD